MSAEYDNTPHKTAPDARPFKWSKVKEEAALLLAVDELTDTQIAEKLEVGRRTIGDWKENPDFRSRIDRHVTEFRDRVRRRGIAIVENRVAHLQRRHDLMNRVIEERANDPTMQNVAGGRTGLMVRNVKSVGAGVLAEKVELFEVDAALLKELREHESQAAEELGQIVQRKDITSGGKPLKGYAVISPDDWDDKPASPE